MLRFEDGDEVMRLVCSPDAETLAQAGAATPDHLLTTKRTPLVVDAGDLSDLEQIRSRLSAGVEEYAGSYGEWYRSHTDGANPMLDPYPRVVLVRGVGMWTAGANARAARAAADIFRHTIDIMARSQSLDRYESLSLQDAYDAEYWPLELYKRTLGPPERELSGRVALVTGAASGIGRAIALRFAEEGAHVVVTDVQAAGARAVAREIAERHGEDRVLHRRMDVSDEDSVREAFRAVRLAFGGLDVLVSNAGIAPVGAIDSLELADWERSLSVNATGHFLVAREAVAILREQGLGGSLIFVATKNVPAPGQELGAYSAAKAAEAQLARVLAIENGTSRNPLQHHQPGRRVSRLAAVVACGKEGQGEGARHTRRRGRRLLPPAHPSAGDRYGGGRGGGGAVPGRGPVAEDYGRNASGRWRTAGRLSEVGGVRSCPSTGSEPAPHLMRG